MGETAAGIGETAVGIGETAVGIGENFVFSEDNEIEEENVIFAALGIREEESVFRARVILAMLSFLGFAVIIMSLLALNHEALSLITSEDL